MKLSKSFSLNELTKSQTAEREGINNNPGETQIEALQRLCENVLQPVRDHYGMPVTVSSGFRSAQLCIKIGSSINSQHTAGQAADFEIFGISNQELAHYIDKNLDYDQLILEFWNPEDKNSGWIHCSYKNPEENRKEFLRAYRDENGKTKYEKYSYIKYGGQEPTKDDLDNMMMDKGI
jgi:zinc D-Ala-D-Ala carboxypeptidase